MEAEGPPIPHDVPLAPQLAVALEAGEVLHVPRPSFGLRALVGEDDLRGRRGLVGAGSGMGCYLVLIKNDNHYELLITVIMIIISCTIYHV